MRKQLQHISFIVLSALLAGSALISPAAAQVFDSQPKNNIRIEELAAPARVSPVTIESHQQDKQREPLTSPNTEKESSRIASLSFAWNMPVNLAVFKRQKKLWIVFDHPQMINLEEIAKNAGDLAANIFQFPHPGATILQLTPREDVEIFVRKEGLLWIVDLITGRDLPSSLKDTAIFTQYDSLKRPYLFIPSETSGNVVAAIDPDVGDIITIAPTAEAGYGLNQPYRYPEFDMLKTKQGLAFVIKAPDILLSRGNTGLTLRARNRGLSISDDLESIKRHQQLKLSDDSLQTFNLELPPQLLKMKFTDAVDQLTNDIDQASPNEKNKARLELVKYYLSQGLGTEASRILQQMEKAKLPEAATDKFQALKGVAHFLNRRYEDAAAAFEYGSLPQANEAVFWRTLAKAAAAPKSEYNARLFPYVSLIRNYPPEIRDQIAIIGAQTALLAGDDLSAQNFIDILKSGGEERLKNRDAEIAYLNARKIQLQGYPRNAIRDFRQIAQSPDERYSALARFDNAVLSYQIGMMPLKDAIAQLEMLRFAWSEIPFKKKLLEQLSQLYVKDFDYYNALKTLQEILPLAEKNEKQQLISRMVRLFEDIYLNNQADGRMSALKSLALYNDFEWLGRQSRRRNQIIQKLADRLVAVDLLPRASDLLLELLNKNDLTVEERAKTGARLAVIYLFENRAPDAYDILAATENSGISEELQAHRRVVMAKALSALNRSDEALQLLKEDYGKNALLLKTDIYWKAGRWAEASDTIKYLIERPQAKKPLSQEQIGYILDWATTLKKAGKETVLVRLRNKFMPYFDKTKYRSAFNILTNHLEDDTVDLKEINQIVNDVQNFSNFSKIYNDSLKNTEIK